VSNTGRAFHQGKSIIPSPTNQSLGSLPMIRTAWILNTATPLKVSPFIRCLQRGFKVDISLVSKLRKECECSISKAKEALQATDNNYTDALSWLHKSANEGAEKRALKLSGRQTCEGRSSSGARDSTCQGRNLKLPSRQWQNLTSKDHNHMTQS
jgi:hypothetical protein